MSRTPKNTEQENINKAIQDGLIQFGIELAIQTIEKQEKRIKTMTTFLNAIVKEIEKLGLDPKKNPPWELIPQLAARIKHLERESAYAQRN